MSDLPILAELPLTLAILVILAIAARWGWGEVQASSRAARTWESELRSGLDATWQARLDAAVAVSERHCDNRLDLIEARDAVDREATRREIEGLRDQVTRLLGEVSSAQSWQRLAWWLHSELARSGADMGPIDDRMTKEMP